MKFTQEQMDKIDKIYHLKLKQHPLVAQWEKRQFHDEAAKEYLNRCMLEGTTVCE